VGKQGEVRAPCCTVQHTSVKVGCPAASVVVHVLDISAPNAAAQCSAVLQVGWAGRCCGEGGREEGGREGILCPMQQHSAAQCCW
jgi:hypothetical protein